MKLSMDFTEESMLVELLAVISTFAAVIVAVPTAERYYRRFRRRQRDK
jgi:hypothetical protein